MIELERLAEADHQAAIAFGRSFELPGEAVLQVRYHRAMGNAHRALSQLDPAFRHYGAGITAAKKAGMAEAQGMIRMSRAGAHSIAGDPRRAMADLRRAEQLTDGPALARVLFQRAVVVQRFSEGTDALGAYDAVIPLLEQYRDEVFLAHAVSNRGLLLTYQGDLPAAIADLRTGLALYERLDMPSPAAVVIHNLGLAYTRLLDLPAALRHFDDAEDRLRSLGRPLAGLQVDRAEALLSAGLVDDANELAGRTAKELQDRGLLTDLAEALLIRAQSAAAASLPEASEAARQAAAEFDRQSRGGWGDRARLLQLELMPVDDAAGRDLVMMARRLHRRLTAQGLQGPAARAAVIEGRLAIGSGRLQVARNCLQRSAGARRSGLIEERLAYWQLLATIRLAESRRRDALAAVRRGLQDLDAFREGISAPDARAGVAIHAERLIDTGLQTALVSPRPSVLFRWMASTAEAYTIAPALTGDGLTSPLSDLRQVSRELIDAGDQERPGLLARRRRLERTVQQRSRRQRRPGQVTPQVDLDEALAELEGRWCVAFADIDGTTYRCARDPRGRYERTAVGDTDELARRTRSLLARLRRLATSPSNRAGERLEAHCSLLGEQLLADLPTLTGDVVVVPRGPLALIPWRLLPQLHGADVSITLSLSALVPSRPAGGDRRGPLTVIVGPRLEQGLVEADRIRASVDNVEVVSPAEATAEAAREALRHSAAVHFACHGEFRSDNPLFSHLELIDGPLTVYDLLTIGQPLAREVVLSSCSGAEVSSRPERAFVGMSGGLLAAGIQTLTASVAPVVDSSRTADLMASYHRLRQEGANPSRALNAAQSTMTDPLDRMLAGSFLTIGASPNVDDQERTRTRLGS